MPVFLFTDIENSTRLWEKYPAWMGQVLSRHDAILRREIERYGGRIIKHTGDGVFAIFEGGRPLHCALEVQKALAREDWGEIRELRIRIALHAGEAERRGEDYFGPTINRTARLLSSGWGGQVLLTPEVLRTAALPEGASTEDLGFHFFKDLGQPQQVYGLVHPELPLQKFPPLRSLSAHPHNLPVQPTPFVGREKDLAQVLALLDNPDCRLLTLVGPGGIGKTRLALQAAAEKVEDFTHGVYFVPLAALTGPEFIVSAVADALRFSFYSARDPWEQLFNYLREKKVLLVLDNFEHLVAGAGLVAELLQAAPGVKAMVTSREALRLRGEWVLPLEGLERPAEEEEAVEHYEAVQLFLQGARRARPDFALSAEDRPAVVRICRLVEGLPLGIELASSWVRMLSCGEIVREIERGLDFLSSAWRDVPERHRSLRAVFDSSWTLLAEEERRALARLSVFRGGFRREAAKEVTGVSLPVLSSLLDKSLLRCTAGRYEILETLLQYAEEKLQEMAGERDRVRDLHSLFYIHFLQEREKPIKEGREEEALREIREEHENIREAWGWAVEGGKWEEIGRATESLYLFYEMRSLFHEGEQVFRQTMEALRKLPERDVQQEAALGRVLARYGWCCERLGRYQEARELFAEALAIALRLGDLEEASFDAAHMGAVYRLLGEYDLARRSLQESLNFARESGLIWPQAHAFLNLGNVLSSVGDQEGACRAFQECLDLFRQIGYRRGIAAALNNWGLATSALGDYEEAGRLFRESLALFQETGDHRRSAFALANLGYISGNQGLHAEAERLGWEALAIFREIGERWAACTVLSNLGASACAQGKYPVARRYLLEALRMAKEMQALPRVLDILADLADVLYGEGAPSEALEILAAILRHPAVEEGTREHAGRLLEKLREELSPEVVAVALEQAEAGDWEEVLGKFEPASG